MRRFLASSLLLLLLLSSNVWSLELCRDVLSKVSDCCRDGFCPHHNHIESPQDSDGQECVCKLSPNNHELLVLSVSGPAIISANSSSPLMEMSRLVEFDPFRKASFDQTTLTPPPKA
jgi:hypothetical protein